MAILLKKSYVGIPISPVTEVVAAMTRKFKQCRQMCKRSSVKSTTVQSVGYS